MDLDLDLVVDFDETSRKRNSNKKSVTNENFEEKKADSRCLFVERPLNYHHFDIKVENEFELWNLI